MAQFATAVRSTQLRSAIGRTRERAELFRIARRTAQSEKEIDELPEMSCSTAAPLRAMTAPITVLSFPAVLNDP